ncbi:MAG: cold shock domain-containing protein [Deltaproteobacteria bacterium]|nr:cold shock domain-containing protein [Deltaproteobacteria bacterium]
MDNEKKPEMTEAIIIQPAPKTAPITAPVHPPTPAIEIPEDKFRKGTVIKYFSQAGYGFIRDQGGKEIYFHVDEFRFVGPKNDRSYISEGMTVGIDVGRTSRGLRVTRMKVY